MTLDKTTRADLLVVLNILHTQPQTYHAQGPTAVLGNMELTIRDALDGKFAGIASMVYGRTARLTPEERSAARAAGRHAARVGFGHA